MMGPDQPIQSVMDQGIFPVPPGERTPSVLHGARARAVRAEPSTRE